jgi:hypothetical protein
MARVVAILTCSILVLVGVFFVGGPYLATTSNWFVRDWEAVSSAKVIAFLIISIIYTLISQALLLVVIFDGLPQIKSWRVKQNHNLIAGRKERRLRFMNKLIGGISLTTALFFGLKVGGLLAWSWVWVFSPLWISAIVVLLIIVLLGMLGRWILGGRKNG